MTLGSTTSLKTLLLAAVVVVVGLLPGGVTSRVTTTTTTSRAAQQQQRRQQDAADELPITTSDVFVQSGEVSDTSIHIMTRCNQEVNASVAIQLNGTLLWNLVQPVGTADDYTLTMVLEDLMPRTLYTYAVTCVPLDPSLPTVTSRDASFTTLPTATDATVPIRFVWAADLAGQGWGRNPDLVVTTPDGGNLTGGYVVFETMASLQPHFALFQGDMIYADNVIPATQEIPPELGGGTWRNNPSKDFVAVTLDDFRANWKYNFGDDKMQAFLAQTPVFVQWDDHEVSNNWWPGEILGEPLYPNGTSANSLYEYSLQAFYEYNPLMWQNHTDEEDGSSSAPKMYRSQRVGQHLELFLPDFRSYRDPNTNNTNPEGSAMMGRDQLDWLKAGLLQSDATWKIISSHDPLLSGIVTGGPGDYDAFGQDEAQILGRELELQELLSFIYQHEILGVVSLTSDVHFAAHVHIDPSRAQGGFVDFNPLDEFVIGPIHAGAFGPGSLDTSFGPEYEYVMSPGTVGLPGNMPPTRSDLQSFGYASVSAAGDLEIKIMDIAGNVMYTKTMTAPQRDELPITTSDVFVQSGELSDTSINIMTRCNMEHDSAAFLYLDGAMIMEQQVYSADDYTVTFELQNLTSNTMYNYYVVCQPLNPKLSMTNVTSMDASFTTLPTPEEAAAVSFVWAADLAGQGWGRNPDLTVTTPNGSEIKGGYVVFETMGSLNPHFALFQGDMIYADNKIPPTQDIPAEVGGGIWVNNPSKNFVANTLDDFRANWKYNFGDDKMQSFLAKTPVFVQWDDHEVTNNWWPGEVMGAPLYMNGTAVNSLYENSLQAFYEFNPIVEGSKIYRSQRFGKNLEIFFPDYRSYRDPNTGNIDPAGIAMMGREQLDWLKEALLKSSAIWKIISSHDPLGIVTGGPTDWDAFGQDDPMILGRELEVQELLSFIYDNGILGVVSLTSDVHFSAHVNIDPSRAEGGFVDYYLLDEFVIGPINSGAFGPGSLDTSFGPEYVYVMSPGTVGLPGNMPPSKSDLQSFGYASVSAEGDLEIKIIDIAGNVMYSKTMSPQVPDPLPITTSDVFVQSGEVSDSSINIMARCNSETDSTASLYLDDVKVMEQQVYKADDFTVTFVVDDLTSNTMYTYKVMCMPFSTTMPTVSSMDASFTTLPSPDEAAAISFVWAADLAGQGWGRNPKFSVMTPNGTEIKGGYIVFETMKSLEPHFALFQGDMIYADNAIPPIMSIPSELGGGNWINNPAKDFVAVTLDEFRANWKYNFGDEKMQSFLSKTPVFVQWDDHEVTNNWWPGEIIGSPLYPDGTAANSLYINSLQAFYEFNPIVEDSKIYRSQRFGKHLEIFFPDFRSYRDPNPGNSDPAGIAMMGREQLDWLKNGLLNSDASWKIISSHDPLGIVTGGIDDYDAFGQDDAMILGRELEVQELLSFIYDNGIKGVVSLTSDVHFTAHVNLDPSRAQGGFVDYYPLDEFVIGPINSGAFGPGSLDTSFGPEYVYVMAPGIVGLPGNMPPAKSDLQSFGYASVSASGDLEIKLMDIAGNVMYSTTMPAPMVEPLPITTSDVFVQSGELSDSTINIMARCNNEVDSVAALYLDGTMITTQQIYSANDFTITFGLEDLTSDTKYTFQVMCTPLDTNLPSVSSVNASFTTLVAPDVAAPISFVWAADLAGQGWGRNPDFTVTTPNGTEIKGGYVVFETMESLNPMFALFQGDMIYADNAIPPMQEIPAEVGGGTWVNNPAKDFVAVTLDDFRANWKYNFGDDKMQSFLAKTPVFVQWDDHEVTNNWWPGEIMGEPFYVNGTAVDSLYENSLKAFYEFNPIMADSQIYRSQRFGQHLEIFFPDFRSYRDPNPGNDNPSGIAMMGRAQLEWLKNGLLNSDATWKIISSHDPLGIVTGGPGDYDAFGQEDPMILGRELEIQELLSFVADSGITGVVSLTSDVHFTAHVNLDPSRAEGGFSNFLPLDEFVIGPINSGAFGPNAIDSSFGPEYVYSMAPGSSGLPVNTPPSKYDLQSFGHASISSTGDLKIQLMDISGKLMYSTTLTAP